MDVEPDLLPSALGSGSRVVGVYRERWSEPGGDLSVYLHGVHDPGNVGTIIRSAHALADGPVISARTAPTRTAPKAVRASMGSIFARPPARAAFDELTGTTDGARERRGDALGELSAEPPVVLCLAPSGKGCRPRWWSAASAAPTSRSAPTARTR